jgi:hypothetical protein
VKVELTITVQQRGQQTARKTVTVVASNYQKGLVRTRALASGGLFNRDLNVDATPRIVSGDRIQLSLTLDYSLPAPDAIPADNPGNALATNIQQSVTVFLENGKSMVAAVASDPAGDRQAIVEVKATIMR